MPQPAGLRFVTRVRDLMAQQGVSHGDLAKRLEWSRSAVTQVLNSTGGLGLDRAERIARALGTTLADLVAESS